MNIRGRLVQEKNGYYYVGNLLLQGVFIMKLRVLLAIFLIIILTACSSNSQTVVSDKVIFYGEGEYWNAKLHL